MISCNEAVRQLWEYLEQDLDVDDRGRVDEHLAFCRRCCGEAEFANALRQLLVSSGHSDVPPDVPADVEARLAGFLDGLEEETT